MQVKTFIFSSICIVLTASCKEKFKEKKGEGGLKYEFTKKGEGREVQQGNWLKLQVIQKFNDSILSDTRKTKSQYIQYDSVTMSKESYSIFSKVSVGDSLTFRVPADSAFKTKRPAFAKKGGFLVTFVKVEDIFQNERDARMDADPEAVKREEEEARRNNEFGNGGMNGGGGMDGNGGMNGYDQQQEYGNPNYNR